MSLELGELTPHELAVKWKLKWSEAIVGIQTSLGEVTLALAHNEFLACVEGGAYARGSVEFVATSTLESPIVRLVHGREKPAAPGAAVYGLRLVSPPELVVIDPITANVIAVEGRVVQGFDVIDRIREQLKTDGKAIEIVSISRLVCSDAGLARLRNPLPSTIISDAGEVPWR